MMERELQKMELKNEFRGLKLGVSLLFIDTMVNSWLLDKNNSDAQDCAKWQVLIGWNILSINNTSVFWSNKMLPHH